MYYYVHMYNIYTSMYTRNMCEWKNNVFCKPTWWQYQSLCDSSWKLHMLGYLHRMKPMEERKKGQWQHSHMPTQPKKERIDNANIDPYGIGKCPLPIHSHQRARWDAYWTAGAIWESWSWKATVSSDSCLLEFSSFSISSFLAKAWPASSLIFLSFNCSRACNNDAARFALASPPEANGSALHIYIYI